MKLYTLCSLILFFLSIPKSLFSFVEVSGQFSYSKQLYGDQRDLSYVERGYGTSVTFYFLSYTGIELNYAYREDIATDGGRVDLTQGVYLLNRQSRQHTATYGVGLKQGFGGRGALIAPVISLGYAKQMKSGEMEYRFDNNGQQVTLITPFKKVVKDAVFGQFLLKIRLTQMLSLTGSVRTVFQAFKYNEAKNDLEYQAGFSCFF